MVFTTGNNVPTCSLQMVQTGWWFWSTKFCLVVFHSWLCYFPANIHYNFITFHFDCVFHISVTADYYGAIRWKKLYLSLAGLAVLSDKRKQASILKRPLYGIIFENHGTDEIELRGEQLWNLGSSTSPIINMPKKVFVSATKTSFQSFSSLWCCWWYKFI